MSVADPLIPLAAATNQPSSEPSRRPLGKRVMHWVRRAHLYFGLFLFPWAVLYGVTAFLFNHPTVFSDQPTVAFGKDALVGTPMESLPPPTELAALVVDALNAKQRPSTAYQLVQPERAGYAREFAFATVNADGRQISVLVDVVNGGGTIRSQPRPPIQESEKAPFAVGAPSSRSRGVGPPVGGLGRPGGMVGRSEDAIRVEGPLHERVKAAVPVVLERNGFPQGEVTVTSVPELTFFIEADGKVWKANYNAMSGSVSGKSADAPAEEISVRRFLTRLHLAHGYPSSVGARWFWAVIVDAMAFVMLFWGISGLFMWWQIKATRKLGFVILLLSAATATVLGIGMLMVMIG